jgi:hypothetical protein
MATRGFGSAITGEAAPGAAADDAQAKVVAAAAIAGALGGSDSDKKAAANMVDGVAQAARSSDAASSGDSAAQAQAGVNALKSLVTGGKAEVKTIPREELKTLLPDSAAGLPRSGDATSKSGTFAGIAASGASATYGSGNRTIELAVGDMGNMGGLAMLANLGANLSSTDSDEGYAKTVDVDGHKVHEQWTAAGKQSELFEIVDDRYAVTVTGSGVDMDAALQALRSVDTARFAQLAPSP